MGDPESPLVKEYTGCAIKDTGYWMKELEEEMVFKIFFHCFTKISCDTFYLLIFY